MAKRFVLGFRAMDLSKLCLARLRVATLLVGCTVFAVAVATPAAASPFCRTDWAAAQDTAARSVGTVKKINDNVITLTPEQGPEVTVTVADGARLLRVEPGAKDLKNAAPLTLQDLLPGDRILVRGQLSPDGKAMRALSVIAMKKEDIAAKQAREREAWQRNSMGGLVSSVDTTTNTVIIKTSAMGANKIVAIHITPNTILRRYAPGSVKFDDAKPAPSGEIKVGDQLRARGTRSADGSELTADEVVSGSFRNIAGTISSVDVSAGTLTVADLATKRPIVVKVTSESQVRKLPPEMAQRIATRLRTQRTQQDGEQATQRTTEAQQVQGQQRPASNAGASGGSAGNAAGTGGPGSGTGRGAPDLQQAISRMPAASLGDLQKGEAVMIVATPGQENGVTAITLLAGVDPILQASPEGQSILSPWSLNGAPSGEAQ